VPVGAGSKPTSDYWADLGPEGGFETRHYILDYSCLARVSVPLYLDNQRARSLRALISHPTYVFLH